MSEIVHNVHVNGLHSYRVHTCISIYVHTYACMNVNV